MIVKVTPDIWYGDKPSVVESLGEVKSIINVAHAIRKPYWKDLGKLNWETWYFRLACPDRIAVDANYMKAMENVLDAIKGANKFPLLCHCRAGGHRGPTAAFFAAYFLDGSKRLQYWLDLMDELRPGFTSFHKHRIYRQTVIEYCKK